MRLDATDALGRLRLRLTLWYALTLLATLALLGGGLFVTIRRQIADQLDASLADATAEVARAAKTREFEATTVRGQVVDAVEELRIPDRTLYLLTATGAPVVPPVADEWVRDAARRAGASPAAITGNHEVGNDRTLRYRGERFTLPVAGAMVAIAVADKVELEDRYASLIAAFGAAAAAALILVAVGGSIVIGKATRPAEESMARMRRFMADAAHELRTPITVLRARADVALQASRPSAELQGVVEETSSELRRLGAIVEDLLTLARADAGERPVARERCSLDDVVLDAANAVRAVAAVKGVRLDVTEFDEAWVTGDAHLLRQLALILLDNAVKFTPAGGAVTVRVGVRAGAPAMEVRDTGRGIPAEDLPRVFERFYRGDAARTRDPAASDHASGAGLGLSIAQWIAEAHGAQIGIESSPGAGTTVTVRFPEAAGPPGPGALSAS